MNRDDLLQPGTFASIPKSILSIPTGSLTPSAKLAFLAIIERMGEGKDHSFPGAGTIGGDTGLSRRGSQIAVDELFRKGLIEINPPKDDRPSNTYRLPPRNKLASAISSLAQIVSQGSAPFALGGSANGAPGVANHLRSNYPINNPIITTEGTTEVAATPQTGLAAGGDGCAAAFPPLSIPSSGCESDTAEGQHNTSPPGVESDNAPPVALAASDSDKAQRVPTAGESAHARGVALAAKGKSNRKGAASGSWGRRASQGGGGAALTDAEKGAIQRSPENVATWLCYGRAAIGKRMADCAALPPTAMNWAPTTRDFKRPEAGATLPALAGYLIYRLNTARATAKLTPDLMATGKVIGILKPLIAKMTQDQVVARIDAIASRWPDIKSALSWCANLALNETTIINPHVVAVVDMLIAGQKIEPVKPAFQQPNPQMEDTKYAHIYAK